MAKKRNGNASTPASAPRVDLAEVTRVLAFMSEHGLQELEYSSGEFRVRLKRQEATGAGPSAVAHAPAPSRAVPPPAPPAAESQNRTAAAPPAQPADHLHTVKSPIVGTFYASPTPDAAPFVKVGDVVSQGQILCIVEAMKLMNEIESDQAGEIARVFVENGQPVEYGQPLFALQPA